LNGGPTNKVFELSNLGGNSLRREKKTSSIDKEGKRTSWLLSHQEEKKPSHYPREGREPWKPNSYRSHGATSPTPNQYRERGKKEE